MVANIRGYTPNYGLKLINFDTPRWHTLEYSNWELVDAIMASTGLPGLRGEWVNSTSYIAGERVFDSADGKIYGCLVTHTSAAIGTFAADRAAHPTYWMLQTLDTPRYRGNWAAGVAYSVADIVFINSYTYYICIANHTSSATFPPDAVKWSLVFDATAAVNTTNANATAASNSATQAATSATNAATSATNAQASAVESAAQAAKLYGTSTSSVTIGLGGKTFITQASKYFNVGKFIMVRADSDPVNQWMWGQVTSYSGTTLAVNALTSGGSGTFADWIIDVSGSRGAIGPQGPQGDLGPPLVIKGTVTTASALPPTGNTIGDMYIAEDTQNLHIWDGAQWDNAGPLGTSTTTTADAAPSNPKDGDMWWESDTGIFWVRYDDGNSAQWIQAGGAAASINQNAVLKTGDTMTGDLTISKASPSFILDKAASGQQAAIYSMKSGAARWGIVAGNPTAEGGSNSGSDFNITPFNDAGAPLSPALTIIRSTGTVYVNNLGVSATTPSTSPSTGALTVAGGLGVGGAINCVGNIVADGGIRANNFLMSATSATDGLVYWGLSANNYIQYGAGKFVFSASPVNMLSAVASTSPSTGALTVAGGLGVGGNICLPTANVVAIGVSAGIDPVAARTNGISLNGNAGNGTILMRGPGMTEIGGSTGTQNIVGFYSDNGSAPVLGGVIQVNGATCAYGTSSDANLKEDLKSFDAGNIIDDTEVYDFAWKATGERAYGIIAQQAVTVYDKPMFRDEKEDRWFVDYSKYVPVLLQELKALRQRVAELEGKSTTPEAPKRGRGSK